MMGRRLHRLKTRSGLMTIPGHPNEARTYDNWVAFVKAQFLQHIGRIPGACEALQKANHFRYFDNLVDAEKKRLLDSSKRTEEEALDLALDSVSKLLKSSPNHHFWKTAPRAKDEPSCHNAGPDDEECVREDRLDLRQEEPTE